jgi:thymidylate synthase (FAD)
LDNSIDNNTDNNISTDEKVLDKGFVRLIDHMGSDEDIEQAARVSYDKGTRPVSDIETLIRYLMRHSHLTPLEMVEFKFHIKIPLFCFSQMVRHRTANLNVRSYRYSEFEEEYCYLPRERYLEQSKQNKQKSGDVEIFSTEEFLEFSSQQESTNREQQAIYDNLLEKKCAREVARIHLPQECVYRTILED